MSESAVNLLTRWLNVSCKEFVYTDYTCKMCILETSRVWTNINRSGVMSARAVESQTSIFVLDRSVEVWFT